MSNIETEKNNNNIRVVDLAEFETEYPYQQETKRWVNYGEINSYLEFLFELYLNSPTNSAVINATSLMVAGGGITTDNLSYPFAATALSELFSTEDLLLTSFNLKTFGYAIWIVTTTDKVVKVEAQDSINWLSGVKGDNGKVEEWWFCEDWNSPRGKNKPIAYPIFKQYSKNIKEVYVIKLPLFGFKYYPPVDYSGAITSIQTESEIANFHLSAIQSGLFPGTIFNFNNGIPPEDEQKKIESDIKRKFSGSSNAGKFVLSFNDNKDNATTMETLRMSGIDKQYQFLSKETESKILVGHRVTSPLLFGIRDGSGLGNNAEELKDSYILYFDTVVKPLQKRISTGISEVLYKNNLSAPLSWVEYMPFLREKNTQLKEHKPLGESDRIRLLSEMNSKKVSTKNYIILSEIPMKNKPKQNGSFVKLFKFNRIDKKNNVLYRAMETDQKEGNMYKFEDIQDFPKMDGFYWTEVTLKKIESDE